MKVYRLIGTLPYDGAVHPERLDVYRHIIIVGTTGIEYPTCPCIVVYKDKVMLPSREIWNLGGNVSAFRPDSIRRAIKLIDIEFNSYECYMAGHT
jgi:hypothetical protein